MKRRTAISMIVSFAIFCVLIAFVFILLLNELLAPRTTIGTSSIVVASIICLALVLALIFSIVDRNRLGVRISAIIALIVGIGVFIIVLLGIGGSYSDSFAVALSITLAAVSAFVTYILGIMCSSLTKQPSKATYILACVGIPLWLGVPGISAMIMAGLQGAAVWTLLIYVFIAAAHVTIAFLVLNIVFPIDKNVNFFVQNITPKL